MIRWPQYVWFKEHPLFNELKPKALKSHSRHKKIIKTSSVNLIKIIIKEFKLVITYTHTHTNRADNAIRKHTEER